MRAHLLLGLLCLVIPNRGARAAVTRAGAPVETETVGGRGGKAFKEVPEPRAVLVGFRAWTFRFAGHRVVKALRPIWLTDRGRRDGETHGQPGGDDRTVVARPGYTVGALVGRGGDRLDGFKLVFTRIRGGALDPGDSYDSEWIGGPGGGREIRLEGGGGFIVGVHGRRGADLDCVGLLVGSAHPAREALAASQPVSVGDEAPELPQTIITVTFVKPGSLPDRLGVRRGDVLLRFGGRPVERTSRDSGYAARATNLSRLAAKPAEGSREASTLEVVRDGRRHLLRAPPGGRPDSWEMSLLFVRNILPALDKLHPGGGPWRGHAEKSIRRAAQLDWRGSATGARAAVKSGLANADLFAHLGTCLCRLPDYEAAEEAFGRALRIRPEHEQALRGMALVCVLTARPKEALRILDVLAAGGGRLDKDAGHLRAAAEEQAAWAAFADVDAERRRRDILRPVHGEGASPRALPPEDVFRGMPKTISFEYDKHSNVSEVELSDFAVGCTVSGLRAAGSCYWLQHTSLRFSHHTEPVSIGLAISCDGSAMVWYSKGHVRLPSLSCLSPVGESNRLLVVREGHRLRCLVNGVTVATVPTSDLPMRFYFSVLAARARFSDLSVAVPALGVAEVDETEVF